jgi:hypothetical protein
MGRYVEFTIPTGKPRKGTKTIENPKFRRAYGEIYNATIDGKRVKFVIQTKCEGKDCDPSLVHYASGYVISRDLQAIRIQQMPQGSQFYRMTMRQAAKACLANRIHSYGEKYIIDALASVPVINVG